MNIKRNEYILALEVAMDVMTANSVMGWTNPIMVRLRELKEEMENDIQNETK